VVVVTIVAGSVTVFVVAAVDFIIVVIAVSDKTVAVAVPIVARRASVAGGAARCGRQ
jgi:hypothetical protein